MAQATDTDLESLYSVPMDELRKKAEVEAAAASTIPPEKKETPAVEERHDEPKGPFEYKRTIDLGDGGGVQVFTGRGDSREDAYEDLTDKLVDAQAHATRKIRELNAKVKPETVPEKTYTADEETLITQELMSKPTEAFKKLFREMTGVDIEDFKTTHHREKAFLEAQTKKQTADAFIVAHPDYVDNDHNGQLINKWCALHNDFSSQSFEKAYNDLKDSGLLVVKAEEASDEQKAAQAEAQRIADAAAVAASSQRTKRSSGLSTQRHSVVPSVAEPTEDELYTMPLDKLKALANKQLSASR